VLLVPRGMLLQLADVQRSKSLVAEGSRILGQRIRPGKNVPNVTAIGFCR
jgi:hypothetical protein